MSCHQLNNNGRHFSYFTTKPNLTNQECLATFRSQSVHFNIHLSLKQVYRHLQLFIVKGHLSLFEEST